MTIEGYGDNGIMTNNINKSNKCAGHKKTIYEMRKSVTMLGPHALVTMSRCHEARHQHLSVKRNVKFPDNFLVTIKENPRERNYIWQ